MESRCGTDDAADQNPATCSKKEASEDQDTPEVDAESTKRLSDVLNQPPEYWTERIIYHYFTRLDPLVLPKLLEVEEVFIRKRGAMKFRVVFENSNGERCSVLFSGTLLYRHYMEAFVDAKRVFL